MREMFDLNQPTTTAHAPLAQFEVRKLIAATPTAPAMQNVWCRRVCSNSGFRVEVIGCMQPRAESVAGPLVNYARTRRRVLQVATLSVRVRLRFRFANYMHIDGGGRPVRATCGY